MRLRRKGTWVLVYESVGFGLILLFTWFNELVGLPGVLARQPHVSNLSYCLVETLIIVPIWAVVFVLTRRLLAHLYYLEGFLRVCAWCRKVAQNDEWLQLEQYFATRFHIGTSHGICPDCLKKVEEDTKRLYRSELKQRHETESAPGTVIAISSDPSKPANPAPEREAA